MCVCASINQMVFWGNPTTPGHLDSIDYFMSGDVMEIDVGQTHYTEQLIRLEGQAIWYILLPPPSQLACALHVWASRFLRLSEAHKVSAHVGAGRVKRSFARARPTVDPMQPERKPGGGDYAPFCATKSSRGAVLGCPSPILTTMHTLLYVSYFASLNVKRIPLVRMCHAPSPCVLRYDKIALPPPAELHKREHYGLQPDWVVFACPQSNFKMHPDFDLVLARWAESGRAGCL